MMDLKQIEEYIVNNGVPVTRPIYKDGQRLRVLDVTSLPGVIREHFDGRGFYKEAKTKAAPKESMSKKGAKKK